MTAVCLKAKSSLNEEIRSNIFASFNTEAKSSVFIKQLTSTCISTILYLRKVLSDDYFETISFEGMTLKLLKSREGEKYVSKIEQWMEGAFEAVEKKYLKRLMLDIQDSQSNMTLEIYTMTFNYNTEKEVLNALVPNATSLYDSAFSISNTKLNTVKLLQMCHAVTQTYRNLPSQVKLSMRLSYYENTPSTYQPKGYMNWEPVNPIFPKQARSIEIGLTCTQHHFFRIFNKSCLSDKFFKDLEDHSENSGSTLSTEKFEDVSQEWKTKAKRELCFDNTKKNIETRPYIPEKKPDTKFIISEEYTSTPDNQNEKHKLFESSTKERGHKITTKENDIPIKVPIKRGRKTQKVRCACLCSERTKTMFPCLGCGFLVHAECYGVLHFDFTKKLRFYCHLCHKVENNLKCHDKVIMSLKNSSDQQKLSLLRRVLRHCTLPYVTRITMPAMKKICGTTCPKNVLNVILNKTIEIGVAKVQGKRKTFTINKQELTNKLAHYFYRVQNTQSQEYQVAFQHGDSEESMIQSILELSKFPIKPYTSRNSGNFKRTDSNEFLLSKATKHSATILQNSLNSNGQTSQQSCDIFC